MPGEAPLQVSKVKLLPGPVPSSPSHGLPAAKAPVDMEFVNESHKYAYEYISMHTEQGTVPPLAQGPRHFRRGPAAKLPFVIPQGKRPSDILVRELQSISRYDSSAGAPLFHLLRAAILSFPVSL
jgi:hypothetical protein